MIRETPSPWEELVGKYICFAAELYAHKVAGYRLTATGEQMLNSINTSDDNKSAWDEALAELSKPDILGEIPFSGAEIELIRSVVPD